jgi:hypothetical protein
MNCNLFQNPSKIKKLEFSITAENVARMHNISLLFSLMYEEPLLGLMCRCGESKFSWRSVVLSVHGLDSSVTYP